MSRKSQGVLARKLVNRPASDSANGGFCDCGDDAVGDALDLLRAQVAAVLDHDLEAARRSQAVDRRRLEDVDQPVLDLVLKPSWSCAAITGPGQAFVGPMVEIVEHHVHRAEVGGVGVHQDRLAGDRQGVGRRPAACRRSSRPGLMTVWVRSSEDESGSWTLTSR